jgi:hypothetical protein
LKKVECTPLLPFGGGIEGEYFGLEIGGGVDGTLLCCGGAFGDNGGVLLCCGGGEDFGFDFDPPLW